MKRYGRAVAALAFLITVVLFAAALLNRPADPLFESKPASAWSRELLNSNYATRENAKTALQNLGEHAVPQLRALLRHRNGPWEKPLVHLNALLPFLNYSVVDANVCRVAASEMLGLLRTNASSAVPDLVDALAHDNSATEVERALVRIGSASIPHLQAALASRHDSVRFRAARLLREFHCTPSMIQALTAATRDRSTAVREQAALSLGSLLPETTPAANNPAAFDALISLSRDRADSVRAAALQALGDARHADPNILSALHAGLRDDAAIASLNAAKSLWALRQPPEKIVPTLIPILDTRERWRAAYLLGDMGESAAPAVPALARLLTQERVPRPFRTPPSSAFALGKIGASAIPELISILENPDSRIRMNALMAFNFMGKAGRPAVPHVLKLLEDKDPEVRHTAALTLASIGAEPDQMIASLSACLHAEDIYMRSAAASVLREIAPGQTWLIPGE